MSKEERSYYTCGDSMKGQVYLILAIVIILNFVLIKTSLNLTKILDAKKNLEISVERLEFSNIRDGTIKTAEISAGKGDADVNDVISFLNYTRNRVKARVLNLQGVVMQTTHPKVVADQNVTMNVTFYNMLGETVNSLSISLSSDLTQNKSSSSIADNGIFRTTFNFTGANANQTLEFIYSTSSLTKTETFNITSQVDKSKYNSFFDLRLIGENVEARDKFIQKFDMPQ